MNEKSVAEIQASTHHQGALASAVGVGADLVDTAVTGTFSIARTARAEAFAMVLGTVDWAEMVQRSGFKIAREIVARIDASTRGALDGCEVVAVAVSRAVRESGASVSAVVSRTSAAIVGEDASRRAA